MLRRTWQAVDVEDMGGYESLGNMVNSIDGNRDVEGMAGREWLLDMVGSYIRNQDVEDQNVEEDMAGYGWLGDMVGSVDSLEIKISKA
eukprot:scaffold12252_cov37-Attheya_sp.AAC.1